MVIQMACKLRNQGKGDLISFRGTLHEVSKHLKKRDIAHIVFQFPKIKPSQSDEIHDGIELFEELERVGDLSEHNVDRLIEAISKLQLQEPLRLLKEYKADHLTYGILEEVRNETTATFKVIKIENNFQTAKSGTNDADKGKKEEIQNIVETKLKSEEDDSLDETSTEINSTNLDVPNKILPGPLDDLSSGFLDEEEGPEEDTEKTSSTCIKHRNLYLNKYCVTCRKRICSECLFLFHKSPCNVVSIDDIAENVDEKISELQKDVRTVSDNCDAVTVEIARKQKVQLANLNKLEKETRDDAIRFREVIDKEERRLLNIVQEYKTKIDNRAAEQTSHCIATKSRLDEIQHTGTKKPYEYKGVAHWEKLTNLQEEVSLLRGALHQQYSNLPETFLSPVYHQISNNGTFGELKLWHLVGGVIIKPNQILHIYDKRKSTRGVLLFCFDPSNPQNTFWQYEENRVSHECPLVMSPRAMYYREYFHALFACGKILYIVHFHSDGSLYDGVKYIEMKEINSLQDGVWITSLFCHQPSGTPCDDFVFSTNSSDKIFEYNISLKQKRIIELNGFFTPMKVSSIAYLKNRFAIINRGSNKVLILTLDRENAQLSYLDALTSSSVFKPVEVISTGARWIVLCVSREVETSWKVLVYKIKTGDMRVCDEGERGGKAAIPVSVTHCQRNGYLSFSNGELRNFEF